MVNTRACGAGEIVWSRSRVVMRGVCVCGGGLMPLNGRHFLENDRECEGVSGR